MPNQNEAAAKLFKAKNIALRFLKVRDRSRQEILERLKKDTFSDETINTALEYLKNMRLVDDRQFTRTWIEARLSKSFGLKRIAFELREKGIDEQLIDEEFLSLKSGNYSEEKVISEIVQVYCKKHKDITKEILKQKLAGYLTNRGFNEETIEEKLRTL